MPNPAASEVTTVKYRGLNEAPPARQAPSLSRRAPKPTNILKLAQYHAQHAAGTTQRQQVKTNLQNNR